MDFLILLLWNAGYKPASCYKSAMTFVFRNAFVTRRQKCYGTLLSHSAEVTPCSLAAPLWLWLGLACARACRCVPNKRMQCVCPMC